MAGKWDTEVTGITITFMATIDVINETISRGANLIITHEPTYFTGWDTTEWLQNDEVYLRKKKLIDENGINIWRFHDHMHMTRPDLIYVGLNKELGWEKYSLPEKPHCYTIPATTVEELSTFLKEKLNVKIAQIVGKKESKVERVGFLVGGGV
jgi:putative NIF3 family GTP cyclohydrolase 1 type 2